jgi:hypothetical protein
MEHTAPDLRGLLPKDRAFASPIVRAGVMRRGLTLIPCLPCSSFVPHTSAISRNATTSHRKVPLSRENGRFRRYGAWFNLRLQRRGRRFEPVTAHQKTRSGRTLSTCIFESRPLHVSSADRDSLTSTFARNPTKIQRAKQFHCQFCKTLARNPTKSNIGSI